MSASPGDNPAAPGHWFEADPLWFKKAVFYEIYIRGFFDSTGDGAGDFRGLIEKLDYIQWLGVDCVWLLPMYASPLREAATTSPTSSHCIPTTGRSRTSAPSSRPPTSAASA
jgi:pullulanase/glycogen debranching enzyme